MTALGGASIRTAAPFEFISLLHPIRQRFATPIREKYCMLANYDRKTLI